MVCQQQAKEKGKGREPMGILCGVVPTDQRPTEALLWTPCYLICVYLCAMCTGYLWEYMKIIIYMFENRTLQLLMKCCQFVF